MLHIYIHHWHILYGTSIKPTLVQLYKLVKMSFKEEKKRTKQIWQKHEKSIDDERQRNKNVKRGKSEWCRLNKKNSVFCVVYVIAILSLSKKKEKLEIDWQLPFSIIIAHWSFSYSTSTASTQLCCAL